MEIKDLEKLLKDALESPDNIELQRKYCDSVARYLEGKNINNEIIPVVIKGIKIDRAANYFDYLEKASNNDLQRIWKQLRKDKLVKDAGSANMFRFLSGLLLMSFIGAGNLSNHFGTIMTLLIERIDSHQFPIPARVHEPILRDYIIDELDPNTKLPKWESIKASGEICKEFAEIILNTTNGENADKYLFIRQWASSGIRFAEELIKKEKIEEKIPKSRVKDLLEIVDHYRNVEKLVRDCIYDAANLQDEIEKLNNEITILRKEKLRLEGEVKGLQAEIDAKEKLINKAEKEVDERAAINEAFGALKRHDESAMLKDIANELKAEYQDFAVTESDEMDIVLGEIYRVKLRNIFKILDKKGISME